MHNTKRGQHGEEVCTCGGHLTMSGAWRYNGRIYTDKFSSSCDKCHVGWNLNAIDVENCQDADEISRLFKQVGSLKDKIKQRNETN